VLLGLARVGGLATAFSPQSPAEPQFTFFRQGPSFYEPSAHPKEHTFAGDFRAQSSEQRCRENILLKATLLLSLQSIIPDGKQLAAQALNPAAGCRKPRIQPRGVFFCLHAPAVQAFRRNGMGLTALLRFAGSWPESCSVSATSPRGIPQRGCAETFLGRLLGASAPHLRWDWGQSGGRDALFPTLRLLLDHRTRPERSAGGPGTITSSLHQLRR
jgi:hypothetical protein